MKTLGQPNPAFADDHGEPDPALRSLMASAYDSNTSYLRAVVALCVGRFLLPIVASGDDAIDGPDPDRHAETAAVLLESVIVTKDNLKAEVVDTGYHTAAELGL